jgi:hypothetical protein
MQPTLSDPGVKDSSFVAGVGTDEEDGIGFLDAWYRAIEKVI